MNEWMQFVQPMVITWLICDTVRHVINAVTREYASTCDECRKLREKVMSETGGG